LAPVGSPARGTFFIFPGKSEYVEKYFEIVGELASSGFAAVVVDWRGQGLSHRENGDEKFGHISHFDWFLDDFEALYKKIGDQCPTPHYCLAHSMGGNIALRMAAERDIPFAALVLSAPMTGIMLKGFWSKRVKQISGLMRFIGRGKEVIPGGQLFDPLKEKFEANRVTHDLRRFNRAKAILSKNPDLVQRAATHGWMNESLKSITRLFEPRVLERLTTPVLLFTAGKDKLVDNRTHQVLARLRSNVEVVVIPQAAHEVMMERDDVRERFWQEFDRFLIGVSIPTK
jgi:lysophospholipase